MSWGRSGAASQSGQVRLRPAHDVLAPRLRAIRAIRLAPMRIRSEGATVDAEAP